MADHTGFIAAAYAVTGLVLAGVVAAILNDHRSLRRALAQLTAQLERRDVSASAIGRGHDDR